MHLACSRQPRRVRCTSRSIPAIRAKPARQGRRAPVETVDVAAIEAVLAAERAFVALQREAQLQAAIQAAEIEAARRREEEAIIVLLLAA